jgi:hypothetical protein
MTTSEVERLMGILAVKWGNRGCEMCGTDVWVVNRRLVTPQMISVENREMNTDDAMYHPSAHISCENCGNTKIVSLYNLGFQYNFGSDNAD